MELMELEAGQALERGLRLPYALIRCQSRMTLGRTPQSVDLTQVLEARFFDADNEIRLFRGDGELRAAQLRGESGDLCIREQIPIENPRLGAEIAVCRHLDADEDGQTYIKTTRLCGWSGR